MITIQLEVEMVDEKSVPDILIDRRNIRFMQIYGRITRPSRFPSFLSVADLSATDYGIASECSLSVCLSVCVSVCLCVHKLLLEEFEHKR